MFRFASLCVLITVLAITAPAEAAPKNLPLPPTDVTISFSGDVLAHNSLYLRARTNDGYNFYKQLRRIRPYLQNSVDICHLETPLTSGSPSSYPRFATPHQLAKGLRQIGFEGCSVVSNHTLDRGVDGINQTLQSMSEVGLKTSGTRLTPSDSAVAWYQPKRNIDIANLAYSYGFNGLQLPTGEAWRANLIDVKQIRRDAAAARAAGAEIVVVSLHWGTEYQSDITSTQRAIATDLTASPNIDAVVGHHAHVIQPAEVINQKPVLYGLGNLWSGQGPWADMPEGQFGVISKLQFRVTSTGVEFVGASHLPTFTQYSSWELTPSFKLVDSVSLSCNSIEVVIDRLGDILVGPKGCD